VLVVNQTGDTLQNLVLELATLGDLKLVERPSSHTLGPHDFLNIKANLKVSSTDTGVIFGNIVYDTTAHAETNVVVLNDIHIDIMDYIHPATCSETEVRRRANANAWCGVRNACSSRDGRAMCGVCKARSSGKCGLSLSGRTRCWLTPTSRTWLDAWFDYGEGYTSVNR